MKTPALILALLVTVLLPAQAENVIYEAVKGKLVAVDGRMVAPLENTSRVENAKFYAIYFSAHWCPPCRKFTPKLAKFYKKYSQRYGDFDVIFVSSDKSAEAMDEYMIDEKMLFPAVKFEDRKNLGKIDSYRAKGIPNLVFVDSEGKVLSASYKDGKYIGPYEVLDEMEDILKEKGQKLAGN
ncbi:MAG: thioredoxin-like domain-containing protein [Verrucomicrobiota bacterium]